MLRHPNILMFQDGVESDKAVYIVTERVQTLYNYLKESKESDSQKENEISWGLYQIAVRHYYRLRVHNLSYYFFIDCSELHQHGLQASSQ